MYLALFLAEVITGHAWIGNDDRYTVSDIFIPIILFSVFVASYKYISKRTLFYIVIAMLLLFSYDSLLSLSNAGDFNYISSAKKIITYSIFAVILGSDWSQVKLRQLTLNDLFAATASLIFAMIYNISIWGEGRYEMPHLRPFFDSIDVALTFLLMQATAFGLRLDNTGLLGKVKLVAISIGCIGSILYAGSRVSIAIWALLTLVYFIKSVRIRYIIILCVAAIATYIFMQGIVFSDYLSIKAASVLNVIFHDPSSAYLYAMEDDSMNVRFRNIEAVLSSIDNVQLIFGNGSNQWRSVLINNVNTSLDNSYLVSMFDFGLIGLTIVIVGLFFILKSTGIYFFIVISAFMFIQDILSNSINVVTVVVFIIIQALYVSSKRVFVSKAA